MSTSALMSLGTRAMFASYASLQTTSANIANANVEGYSRQQAELETAKGQFTGAGFFGKGVDVATVSRAHDEFLTRQAATSKALAAMDQASLDKLSQLENVFPTGEKGIGYAAGQFLNSFVDLASRPQDSSARQVVLSQATELASRFSLAAGQLDDMQAGVTQDLKTSIQSVNSLSARIADVNQQIAQVKGLGHQPNDLLDQRDQLISQLSSYLQVTTIAADDGTLGVFIAGGQRLVLGNQATELAIAPDQMDNARSTLAIVEAGGGRRSLPTDMLTGGSVTGLLRFQNGPLAESRNELGQMAISLGTRVNQQQALGLDLRSPPGSGAPIFSINAPIAGPASTNAKDASGNFVAKVSLSVADATQLVASEYDLQADPASPGNYKLTRLSDGTVRSIADGDTVDGFTVNIGTPAPAATDRFRLQPVARAANGMRAVLDDPRGLAAASPVSATVGVSNTGTASVSALTVVSPAIDPSLTASISFTSAGAYNWSLSDGSSGSGSYTAGQPISLNGFALQLNGVPATGDSFSVGPTQFPATNNGNAQALIALRDEALVGRSIGAGGVVQGGSTITEAYASTMASVGVQVQSAKSAAKISASVAQTDKDQVASKTGVNLDEEAAKLIQFQQGYQAAAKVLQVAQQVFDTLLQTAGGG